LKEKNLIDIVEEEKGSDSVHLTPEGAQAYHDLVEWIEEVIGHDFSYG
jgi:DNA-binding PadR family transcriptional regulator